MAGPTSRVISGTVATSLLTLAVCFGSGVDAQGVVADASSVTSAACPPSWGPLTAGPAVGVDANVSVFAGGTFQATGDASGTEGLLVALGSASFDRTAGGTYEVGTTATGSQVAPAALDDMLLVGGDLTGAADTLLSVGAGIGGNVATAGTIADGTVLDAHGGSVDTSIADAVTPYAGMREQIAGLSSDYAARPTTGTVDATGSTLVLDGDGTSDVQVFSLDTSALEPLPDGAGRQLQLLDVPPGAAVVVDLTGSDVDLHLDGVLDPDGVAVDPSADQYFADLSTHLLWNAPAAASVLVEGAGQVPGSLLVPSASSTTILSASTNGRVWVGGNLLQTAGQAHSYPWRGAAALDCTAPSVHYGSLTVRVTVNDPDGVVGPRRDFGGTYACTLGGRDVTPLDDTWSTRAAVDPVLLSDQLPVGAVCTLDQDLDTRPDADHVWDDWQLKPAASLQVARRQSLGFTVANRVLSAPTSTHSVVPNPQPSSSPTSSPAPSPSSSPTPSPTTPSTPTTDPTTTSSPSSAPTDVASAVALPRVSDDDSPSAEPTDGAPDYPDTSTEAAASDPPLPGLKALTAKGAPLSLAGAVVWGPIVVLSLLVALMIRVRPRPRRPRY